MTYGQGLIAVASNALSYVGAKIWGTPTNNPVSAKESLADELFDRSTMAGVGVTNPKFLPRHQREAMQARVDALVQWMENPKTQEQYGDGDGPIEEHEVGKRQAPAPQLPANVIPRSNNYADVCPPRFPYHAFVDPTPLNNGKCAYLPVLPADRAEECYPVVYTDGNCGLASSSWLYRVVNITTDRTQTLVDACHAARAWCNGNAPEPNRAISSMVVTIVPTSSSPSSSPTSSFRATPLPTPYKDDDGDVFFDAEEGDDAGAGIGAGMSSGIVVVGGVIGALGAAIYLQKKKQQYDATVQNMQYVKGAETEVKILGRRAVDLELPSLPIPVQVVTIQVENDEIPEEIPEEVPVYENVVKEDSPYSNLTFDGKPLGEPVYENVVFNVV